MARLLNPTPIWLNAQGYPLDNGQITIGVAGNDPSASPILVYWDAAHTIVAEQPLRTLGGYIVNGATPASVFIDAADWSLRVTDANGAQILYTSSVASDTQQYQPLDADLTAIGAQGTTAFGRSLLNLANVNALIALLGGLNFLPLTGGTVTGDIRRQGAGAYLYNADAAATSGRVYATDSSASDPTQGNGDLWLVTSS